MSSLDFATSLLAGTAFLVAGILYARLSLAWRLAHDDGRLRLVQMLARHGAPSEALGSSGREAANAMRRCMLCSQKRGCDGWLASGARNGIHEFCPNAEFIGRVAPPR